MFSFSEDPEVLRSVSETPPTHYAVKLEGFSSLAKNIVGSYTTAEFEAGDYKWRLIIYPNGNNSRNGYDNLSVYIKMVESNVPQLWSGVHATFKVFLLDQNKGNYYTLEVSNGRRFDKMNLEWGFDQFMPLKKFNNPSNGYLVNDRCVFGAEVYVCKENNSGKGECLIMGKDVDSYKHTWEVESLSSMDAHESATFNSGDYKWKIQLYPKGYDTGTGSHISIYLALVEPTNLPVASQIYAEFTIRIIDKIHDINKSAKVWFNAANRSRGWPRFMSLSEFSPSTNELLVEDKCVIEAEVVILGVTTAL